MPDIVIFGATGYTGANAPEGSWGMAGRNRDKLQALAERLGVDVPLLHADVTEPDSLRTLASDARVIITTVGPYINYGEPLVAACAETGTDYVDLTGEPEFVDRMYLKHHDHAEQSGARIVHACGFDSIPHDLGTLFTVQQLPEGVPIELEGVVRAGGGPSGGTFHSAITAFSRARQTAQAHKERRNAEPSVNGGRRVRAARPAPRHDSDLGWVVPMPTIDPQIITRSAKALDRYGPDFTYAHCLAIKRLPVVVGGAAGIAGLAQIPPARKWLLNRRPPGSGPSEEQRAKGWFKVRFTGQGGGRKVVTEVAGGDPGYGETSKMLAESALCLAHDDLPQTSGQVTTAVAMGDQLIERLRRAGLSFDVLATMEA